MPTYAIGDVQGCFDPLQRLLKHIRFNSQTDTLWFTGDLVNRGPNSLEVLRFVHDLGDRAKTVLGNHDLALLALSVGALKPKKQDTFTSVLEAKDGEKLINWLKTQPLMVHDKILNYTLAHAGIFPLWNLEKASMLAKEVHQILISNQATNFLHNMFGKEPNYWKDDLKGWDRLKFIVNAFTRMRYCTLDGKLNLDDKGPLSKKPKGCVPWYAYLEPHWKGCQIIFGHWASLDGDCPMSNIFALDTGCVWGRCLTAFCLETKERFLVNCG